ncbi:MAG: hypothetical protein EBZ59_04155 [Planctomycetia bacterium]|nr:hypothetical protein [Planctomycetia bacterium]
MDHHDRTIDRIRIALLLAVAAGASFHQEAVASPARRMARRGVVVVPAPGPVVVGPRGRVRAMPWVAVPTPVAGPGVVVPPAVAPAAPLPGVEHMLPPPAAGTVRPAEPGPTLATPTADPTAAFTPSWYASHPDAWRPPQPLDPWTTTDAAGLDAWLNRSVRTAAGAAADATAVTAAGAVAPDGTRSVLVLPAGHDDGTAECLTLGVFAPIAPGDSGAHSRQLLAVDREARIKGTFYDALSGTAGPISGSIDRETRTASWTLGKSGSRFEAPLEALTSPARTVAVTAGGVTTRGWLMMPVGKP